MRKRDEPQLFICTSENMHPYECYDHPCRHCDRRRDETHDLDRCWCQAKKRGRKVKPRRGKR